MKKLIIIILAVIMLTVPACADWYNDGTLWMAPDKWAYNDHERYVADQYDATLADMADKVEAATPETIIITAMDAEDADVQLEMAMRYAPHVVAITFFDTKSASNYHEKYSYWRENGIQIPALVGAVWTRTDGLFTVTRYRSTVSLTFDKYAEGWLTFVDTTPQIRVYKDSTFSAELSQFRTEIIEPCITEHEGDTMWAVLRALNSYADYDDDYLAKLATNRYQQVDMMAHSVRGFVERRKCVCDGFAATFQFALACAGIKCFEVVTYSPQSSHAFNKVRIDGDWINIDPTVADHTTRRSHYFGFDEREGCLDWVKRYGGKVVLIYG